MTSSSEQLSIHFWSLEKAACEAQGIKLTIPTWEGLWTLGGKLAPMLMKIKGGIVVLQKDNGEKESWYISQGTCRCQGNNVWLLVESWERPEEIDKLRALHALKRAEDRLQNQHYNIDIQRALAALERAKARSSLALLAREGKP